jgi:hypothetical protein
MHDLHLGPEPVSVVDQSLQDTGGHDAAATYEYSARLALERFVDVLVGLVRVDHSVEVLMLLAVALQIGQELQAGVTDG